MFPINLLWNTGLTYNWIWLSYNLANILFMNSVNGIVLGLQEDYEYMYGNELLVAPVLDPGLTEWPVYLPQEGYIHKQILTYF